MGEQKEKQYCWCGVLIGSKGHPNPHVRPKNPETARDGKGSEPFDCTCHVTKIHTDTYVTVEPCPDDSQIGKEPRKPAGGKDGGKIPEPPPGISRDPWDIIQVMLRNCRGKTPPPRKDSYLPYLVVRANPGDRGQRPLPNGTVFWESPDIFVIPNQSADTAPDMPSNPGGVAQAGVPNTVFAHVWNLGRGPAFDVRVEFYWFNPTLGIEESDANLIGFTYVSLGNRNSMKSHALVRCPVDWIPSFVNNGHECLVVRAFAPMSDPLGPNSWSASKNRHVAQRNIAVLQGAQNKTNSIIVQVARGHSVHDAQIVTMHVEPKNVPWIQLLTGKRNPVITRPAVTPMIGILTPSTPLENKNSGINLGALSKESLGQILSSQCKFKRSADPLEISLVARVEHLSPNEMHVTRVQQFHENELVGGYTTIITP